VSQKILNQISWRSLFITGWSGWIRAQVHGAGTSWLPHSRSRRG